MTNSGLRISEVDIVKLATSSIKADGGEMTGSGEGLKGESGEIDMRKGEVKMSGRPVLGGDPLGESGESGKLGKGKGKGSGAGAGTVGKEGTGSGTESGTLGCRSGKGQACL